MHIRRDVPSGSVTGTLLLSRLVPAVVPASVRCWEAGVAQVSALLLDWVVRRCIRISCAIDIVANERRYLGLRSSRVEMFSRGG